MAETCPKCGYADVPGDECPRCRVIVSKYRAHLQSLGTGGVATLVAAPAPSAPPSQWRPSPAGGGPGGGGGGHTGRRAGAVGPSEPMAAVAGGWRPWRDSPAVLPRLGWFALRDPHCQRPPDAHHAGDLLLLGEGPGSQLSPEPERVRGRSFLLPRDGQGAADRLAQGHAGLRYPRRAPGELARVPRRGL